MGGISLILEFVVNYFGHMTAMDSFDMYAVYIYSKLGLFFIFNYARYILAFLLLFTVFMRQYFFS